MRTAVPRATLLIKPGALGDTVCALPLLRALALQGPVDVMGNSAFWVLGLQPEHARRCLSLDTLDWSGLFGDPPVVSPTVRRFLAGYDRVVAFWSRNPERFASGLRAAGVADVRVRPPFPGAGQGHASDWLLAQVPDLPSVPPVPVFQPDEDARATARDLAAPPYALVHAGSGSPRKNWPYYPALVAELRKRPGLPVFALAGPAEADDAALADAVRETGGAVLGDIDLRVVGALAQQAALYVGNDSGVTHLAAAAGAPTLALFGPSDVNAWRPRGPRVCVLRAPHGDLAQLGVQQVAAAQRSLNDSYAG